MEMSFSALSSDVKKKFLKIQETWMSDAQVTDCCLIGDQWLGENFFF